MEKIYIKKKGTMDETISCQNMQVGCFIVEYQQRKNSFH